MRRVRAARQGDRVALRSLWGEVADELFSIACALGSQQQAIEALSQTRATLERNAPALQLRQGFRDQCLGTLWAQLQALLRPGPVRGISCPALPCPGADPKSRLERCLQQVPLPLRMVWVFSSLGGCTAARLAEWSGEPELELRRARAEVSWRLVAAMKGEP